MNLNKIGKYEIVRLIGEGSMGKVYKAFDPLIDRFVALKIVEKEKIQNEELMNRFKKEVRAQGRIIHPNIATVFDVNFYEGNYILVMEYVQGNSLRKILNKTKILTFKEFYTIVWQVCSGLQCAHRNGVIHRDIKPDNIILTERNLVKIVDFSIAKLMSSQATTKMNFLLGSSYYMSPEQIMGMDITEATDQFSFGVVCYEMLTGIRPFQGKTTADSILNITKVDPVQMSQINPMVDEMLDGIIRKMLSKDPYQRFESIKKVKQAFTDYFVQMNPTLIEIDFFDYY